MQAIDHLKYVAESPRTASLLRQTFHKIQNGMFWGYAFEELAQQLEVGFGVKAQTDQFGIRVTSPVSRARKPAQLLITRQAGQPYHPDARVVVSTNHALIEVFEKGEGYEPGVAGHRPLPADRSEA